MGTIIIWLPTTEFVKCLIIRCKQCGLTQQALADVININVNQIKLYDAVTAQPILETLVRSATELMGSLALKRDVNKIQGAK